ncbi:methyltransferase domain-containing protein [Nonomuraea sp. NPDC002799]
MGPRDAMEHINEQDEATLGRFIDRLEARGADPAFTRYRDDYLDETDPSGAVLDLGCGTGVIARALAARKSFTGSVTAVDQSPALVGAGRRLAAGEGVGDRIDFRTGDAHALGLPAASFDAAIAHTLLSHVTDPAAVLREAARVVRPGGTVTIFDGDYASLSFGCSDAALGKTMEEALLSVIVSKPRVMRDLPRLLAPAGLRLVSARANAHAEVGTGTFFLGLAEAFAPLVLRAGVLQSSSVEAWLAHQRRTAEQGTFFAACTYYTYVTIRQGPNGGEG